MFLFWRHIYQASEVVTVQAIDAFPVFPGGACLISLDVSHTWKNCLNFLELSAYLRPHVAEFIIYGPLEVLLLVL